MANISKDPKWNLIEQFIICSSSFRDGPLFFPRGGGGGIVISRRQEIFFYHRLSACKFFSSTHCADIFFKFPITELASADNFFRCTSGADNLFQQFFSFRQFFSQSRYPPEKILVRPLCISAIFPLQYL